MFGKQKWSATSLLETLKLSEIFALRKQKWSAIFLLGTQKWSDILLFRTPKWFDILLLGIQKGCNFLVMNTEVESIFVVWDRKTIQNLNSEKNIAFSVIIDNFNYFQNILLPKTNR